MATTQIPNYDIDYNDERFGKVESDKNQALTELEQTYGGMIGEADKYFDAQIQASKDWADKQAQIQQDNTDFAIEQVEQQKAQANKDYKKEQSGAYVDWLKQSNQYGAEAEKMASQGLDRTGYSESSQVSMYNTYQNRVAAARESYSRAVLNYDNAIKDAMLQNNAALAEIAYQSLQQQLELSLQGFQYKNNLVLEQANKKTELENIYYNRYQDVLQQINTENAMAEEIRQYNETQKWQTEQAQLDREHKSKEAELDRQFQSKEAQIERDFKAKQAQIDRQHEKDMLKAKTAAEKELLKIQHENDIKKLNQQLANEKAVLKYQYDLQKKSLGSVSGSSGGSSGGSSSNKSSGSSSKKTYTTVTKGTGVSSNASTKLQIDMKSVTALGYGPISASRLAQLEKEGKIQSYVSGGKIKYRKIVKGPMQSLQQTYAPKISSLPKGVKY